MEKQIERLEVKILEAIALIKELRSKNTQLAAECADLQARLVDLEDEKKRLVLKLEAATESAAAADELETKRQLIENKVTSLLDKLEALG